MTTDPLAAPATPQRLRALRDAGVLTTMQFERAIAIAAEPPPPAAQSAFAARGALILGGLLSLASVVFFVAHNWAGMSRWARFGILELGLLAFAAAAWRAKGQLTRQVALSLCAAMLGPLLAVYGQTYQTGADPYELFLTWALLAAPVAALARFMPLWVGVWGLLNLSLSLGCEQLQPLGYDSWHYTPVLLAGLNAVGLAAYVLVSRKTKWLGEPLRWPLRTLALAAVLPPLPLGTWYIADWYWGRDAWGLAAAITVGVLCAGLALVFRSDRFVRASAAFAACGLGTALVFRVLDIRHDAKITWLVIGLIIVLETTVAIWWIRGKEVAQ